MGLSCCLIVDVFFFLKGIIRLGFVLFELLKVCCDTRGSYGVSVYLN